MKKIVALLLAVAFCFSSMLAMASDVPEFMKEVYRNYTADYTISATIDNACEIVDFLKETGMPDTVSNYVDMKSLIESLAANDSTVKAEVDISNDFRKIKASLTVESDENVVVNRNLNLSAHAKMGVWVDMDMDARNLLIIYSTPLNEKYAVIDVAKEFPEDVSDEIFNIYDKIFNSEFAEKVSKEMIDLAIKHADVSMKGNTCSVKYDNDAFVSTINDIADYVVKYMEDIASDIDENKIEIPEIPDLEGIQLLGDEGIECTYVLSGGKIRNVSEKWDISVSLADIYNKFTDEGWNYEFDGDLEFSLESKADVTKIGVTNPNIPEINEENSFSIADQYLPLYDEDEYVWDEPPVAYYVWGEIEKDTFDGERYYIPLRECIEGAYWECSNITYDSGVVTITTDCGDPNFDINTVLTVGTDTAIVNGVQYFDLGTFKLIDGKVYAGIEFYEKCLGWTLQYFNKDLLDGYLSYEFYTSAYEY